MVHVVRKGKDQDRCSVFLEGSVRLIAETLHDPIHRYCHDPWAFWILGHALFVRATVNVMDRRATFRADIGFYMGLGAPTKSLHKIIALLAYQKY